MASSTKPSERPDAVASAYTSRRGPNGPSTTASSPITDARMRSMSASVRLCPRAMPRRRERTPPIRAAGERPMAGPFVAVVLHRERMGGRRSIARGVSLCLTPSVVRADRDVGVGPALLDDRRRLDRRRLLAGVVVHLDPGRTEVDRHLAGEADG